MKYLDCLAMSLLSGIVSRPSHLIAKVDNILAWFERYRIKDQKTAD